ncbi:MAG: TIR domain-containing protein [Hyphomonadaceae bacterium]|nr:TIR domain-containing protein [Hyphomonadaceae bacterium]
MADVFISYKSDDRGAVEDIVRGLEREGINLWWDQGIAPTADWRADIARELHAAKVVIVVWSRNSADHDTGKWVIQEAEEADARGGLVPVVIDDVLPPLGLRHVQTADLVDWRGDREDPRWIGFVETVRAKLEGRAVDARVARDTGPQTAKASLRGRVAQLFLALGLATLIVTSAVAFGPLTAAALVGGLSLAYLVLNLLFSRRRNDRAAATFLRRAFAVGWVTTVTNIVVWCAAIGAGAYPYARGALYQNFSIAVIDELRTPVTDAQVTVTFGDTQTRVPLDENGVGHMEYPLFWGAKEGTVTLSHRDHETAREIAREGLRFADLTLGTPSGTERLRVRHITVRGLAMDAVLHGIRPPEFARLVPALAGVVRNEVWDAADEYLSAFPVFQGMGEGSLGYQVGQDGEASNPESEVWDASVNPRSLMGLRMADAALVTLRANFSSGIYGCPINQPLDANYQLVLGDSHRWYNDNVLQPHPEAVRALSGRGLEGVRDEDGGVRGTLMRLADYDFLAPLLANNPQIAGEGNRDHLQTLQFLTEHRPSGGVLIATLNLRSLNLSNCEELQASIDIALPALALRVSFIENVSDEPLPITAILDGMADREAIEVWAHSDPDRTVETPWPGGMLAPGEAIAVPRRLIVEDGLSEDDVARWRARGDGNPISFDVMPDPETQPQVDGPNDPLVTNNARAIMVRSGQVRFIDLSNGIRTPLATPYVIGPSVEALTVRINDVDFDMRDDSGAILAILFGSGVGSCPFVYAARPGDHTMLNRGTIITDQIGLSAERASRRYLGRTVGQIEIHERESEISYLNRVRLIAVGGDGRERMFEPAQRSLRAVDGDYSRLERGDVVSVSFPSYQPRDDDRAVYLEAVGYYTPLPTTVEARLAIRRSAIFQ